MLPQFKKEIGETRAKPFRRWVRKTMMDKCIDFGLYRSATVFAAAFEKDVFEKSMRRSIYEKLNCMEHISEIGMVLDIVKLGNFGNDRIMMQDIVRTAVKKITALANDTDYLRVFMNFPDYLKEFETVAAARGLGDEVKQAARELMESKALYNAVGESLDFRTMPNRDGILSIIEKWAK